MTTSSPFPLNEAQRNRLTITLASVERDVRHLLETIAHPPSDLTLTRYEGEIPADIAPAIQEEAAEVEKHIRNIAKQLHLEPIRETVRRELHASLLLDHADIHDARPSAGLRGYGRVAQPTADYLETEIAKLENSLRKLAALLDPRTKE